MRDIQFKHGRNAPKRNLPRLKLANYLSPVETPPRQVDWMSKVLTWPVYLNDRIGDCTCATVGHIIQALSAYGDRKEIRLSDNDVLTAYSAVSGYNPNTGDNDNGAVIQEVLNYWRKNGIGGRKIIAFAELDYTNLDEVRQALHLFGNVYLGVNLPESAVTQFNQYQPWDYVKGSPNAGGHAINAAWYDTESDMWKIITWGDVQPMTQDFFNHYVEEAWVVITDEWWDEQNLNPEGIDLYALGQDYETLTSEPNPFADVPPVDPNVVPEHDSELEKLIHEFRRWLRRLKLWLNS